jgi:hypothetical protein
MQLPGHACARQARLLVVPDRALEQVPALAPSANEHLRSGEATRRADLSKQWLPTTRT